MVLAAINRSAVVARHAPTFVHAGPIDAAATAYNALTVVNGGFAFTADLTGLQSLNISYTASGSYPLYTMSNWGWHTPDPALLGVPHLFNADGSLDYVYEDVAIDSLDTRPGKGNRTVPYQFDCSKFNNNSKCDFLHTFPARLNLGQLSFVLPDGGGGWRPLALRNITSADQRLDLWVGELASNWRYDDGTGGGAHGVSVLTVVDADTDTHAARWEAPRALGHPRDSSVPRLACSFTSLLLASSASFLLPSCRPRGAARILHDRALGQRVRVGALRRPAGAVRAARDGGARQSTPCVHTVCSHLPGAPLAWCHRAFHSLVPQVLANATSADGRSGRLDLSRALQA